MLWDVFCRVIDNFGDIGVCWRLATDLAQRGQKVRLWLDDGSALTWMAPQVQWRWDADTGLTAGLGHGGVKVHRWADAELMPDALPGLQAGDVVVEAFGCDPPDAFLLRMQARAAQGAPSRWINLEYLSAEDYVARNHGLHSPVWSGAGAGLSKRFFYPGFTPDTGGLLRETGLIAMREAELATDDGRLRFMASLGIPGERGRPTVLMFCYDTAPVGALLNRLAESAPPPLVLLTPGHATRLADAWLAGRAVDARRTTTSNRAEAESPGMTLHRLPALPQTDFDRLLWCVDLNLVRGEDSAVRALWAGRPHIWHIYEQDDGVHAGKLEAFMGHWMAAWPADLRADVTAWWRAWNSLGPLPDKLPSWGAASDEWALASRISRAGVLAQQDLCTCLIDFATSSG
jgi:uncharacterized repeat protein (TIGR03837 family)